MPIKTYRGQIVHGAVDTIVLHTNDGSTGYRIKKFQVMQTDANEDIESTVFIHSTNPGLPTTTAVNFSDQTLLGVAMLWSNINQVYVHESHVIFDNMTFNQDIYISHYFQQATAKAVNYYIELEQVKLDLNQNTIATLKDIRNIEQPAV